jgi:hypothetical protein
LSLDFTFDDAERRALLSLSSHASLAPERTAGVGRTLSIMYEEEL